MSGLIAAIGAADQPYLESLANKGLVRRAQRELPEAGVRVELGDERVTATFADGTVVTMDGAVTDYRCTCPARGVCKHLLMAVLAAREAADAGGLQKGGGTAAPPPPDFAPLAALTPEALQKLAGKRTLQSALLALSLGEKASVEEGSILAVTLEESGHTVRFLPGAPPASATCTCKAAEFCVHRAQALLHYIAHKRGRLPAEFFPEREESPLDYGAAVLPYVSAFTAQVMATGLARLPADSAGRFLQLATICHSQRLANLERVLRRVAGQLEHLKNRSASFERDRLIADLSRVLLLCESIRRHGGDRETVGVFREEYRPIKKLELWGLGAYGWHSTGGYTGVTLLYYAPEETRVFTYTAALPDSAVRSRSGVTGPETLYQGAAPWSLNARLSSVTRTRLLLQGGKLSAKGQLSASDSAVAQPQGRVEFDSPELTPLRFDDFEALLEALWQHDEDEPQGDGNLYAILLPARAGAGDYDKIRQRWTLPLYDRAERRLDLTVRYEPAARLLLENLMALDAQNALAAPMLARVYVQGGKLSAFPIALYGSPPSNLSLDRPAKKQITAIDWGF